MSIISKFVSQHPDTSGEQEQHRSGRSMRDLNTQDRSCSVRLMIVVTSGQSADLLKGQLSFLRERGFDITLVAGPHPRLDAAGLREQVNIEPLAMHREIRPLRDLASLVRLFRLMRRHRPQIVNASTPKAGLLAMLAALLARVPVRIYTLRGLRLETTHGVKRQILALAERLAAACSQRVICVSRSLAREYVRLGCVHPDKVALLGAGSSNGVDFDEFHGDSKRRAQGMEIRQRRGIAPSDPVIGYVGRLARDKGIGDLVRAFEQVRQSNSNAWLLLVGELDTTDPPDRETIETIRSHSRIISTGHVDRTASYYHAMNVFAFPSYREGFCNATLEAQAAGLPVVGYRATGVVDTIIHSVTGRLVPIGAVDEMAAALLGYIDSPELAVRHGHHGQERVRNEFSNERIWKALQHEYTTSLAATRPAAQIAAQAPNCAANAM